MILQIPLIVFLLNVSTLVLILLDVSNDSKDLQLLLSFGNDLSFSSFCHSSLGSLLTSVAPLAGTVLDISFYPFETTQLRDLVLPRSLLFS